MTAALADVLTVMAGDAPAHMSAGPCVEADLAHVEAVVGHPLAASLREFLLRLGCGIYYDGHEIFGPLRFMIHDIELVPDLLTARTRLGPFGEGWLPFHRGGGRVHLIDVEGRVKAASGEGSYLDLASFLATVVIPHR